MVAFWCIWTVLVLERLIELRIARRNTEGLRSKGGLEYGAGHYPIIVALHTAFFLSFVLEEVIRMPEVPKYWPWMAGVFVVSQALRIWTLTTLGSRWTTRVIVVPNEQLHSSGPYRMLRHPNYMVVALEIVSVPLMFGLYWTALLFSVLNALILLGIRIPLENRVLATHASRVTSMRYRAQA